MEHTDGVAGKDKDVRLGRERIQHCGVVGRGEGERREGRANLAVGGRGRVSSSLDAQLDKM